MGWFSKPSTGQRLTPAEIAQYAEKFTWWNGSHPITNFKAMVAAIETELAERWGVTLEEKK